MSNVMFIFSKRNRRRLHFLIEEYPLVFPSSSPAVIQKLFRLFFSGSGLGGGEQSLPLPTFSRIKVPLCGAASPYQSHGYFSRGRDLGGGGAIPTLVYTFRRIKVPLSDAASPYQSHRYFFLALRQFEVKEVRLACKQTYKFSTTLHFRFVSVLNFPRKDIF